MIKIAPSLLSADFTRLAEEIATIEDGADLLHLDVMDGHFVPNITIGPMIVKACRKVSKLPFDCPLMISNPQQYIGEFIAAGADMIDCSSGQVSKQQQPVYGRMYQTPFADRIRNEISRVIAERNLVARDRELARLVAMQWRTRQISAAGGSEARARQLAREETGSSLQALAEQTEARILGILFYQKNILPRATPSANEVRDYFRRHRDEFRVEGAIDFLLIELVRQSGESPDAFEARAARVHARAAAGEDFATLAGEVNDNPVYRQSNGRLPQMLQLTRPGQFRWAAVDAAAWSTPVGRITPVIPEDSGNRRFIARILEQQTPRVLGFDEAQEQITQILTFQRRQALLGELEADATRYAAVTPQEEIDRFLRTAVEVAAQNYQRWRND